MALIGKLVWRILNDQGGLWGNIIKHKYMQHWHGVSFDASGRSSFVWKGITKAWKNLMEGFVWELGNGSSSFWYDSWSPLGKLCDLVPFVHISDTQLQVRDICLNGSWNLDVLYTNIPTDIKNTILRLTPAVGDREDGWVWKGDSSTAYSAASGYRWLIGTTNEPPTEGSWS